MSGASPTFTWRAEPDVTFYDFHVDAHGGAGSMLSAAWCVRGGLGRLTEHP